MPAQVNSNYSANFQKFVDFAVKDIRDIGSQTWPFPSNIMIGFRAEYASGELKPDGEEVIESGWFDRDNLPEIPRPGSIARAMLDAWVKGAC